MQYFPAHRAGTWYPVLLRGGWRENLEDQHRGAGEEFTLFLVADDQVVGLHHGVLADDPVDGQQGQALGSISPVRQFLRKLAPLSDTHGSAVRLFWPPTAAERVERKTTGKGVPSTAVSPRAARKPAGVFSWQEHAATCRRQTAGRLPVLDKWITTLLSAESNGPQHNAPQT